MRTLIFKKKKISDSAKKVDKIVTGLIIGTAIASVIGLSKTEKGKEISKEVSKKGKGFFRPIFKWFGKALVFILKFFEKK